MSKPGYKEVASTMGTPSCRPDADSWTTIDWSKYTRDLDHEGRKLHFVDVGRGQPVVLVHGLGGSWLTWLENVPDLSAGHRVIALDLPGFGRSEAPPSTGDIDVHVESIEAVLNYLGLASAIVVGHSMGGLIALRLANERPARVQGLVLLSGGGLALGAFRLALVGRAFTAFNIFMGMPMVPEMIVKCDALRWVLLRPMLANPASLSRALAAEVIPAVRAQGLVPSLHAAVRGLASVDPAAVHCPVLLVWGARDRIMPVAAARQLAAELPDARLAVIDDVGHCAMFEDPARFNALVRSFVADPAQTYSTREYRYLELDRTDGRRGRTRSGLVLYTREVLKRKVTGKSLRRSDRGSVADLSVESPRRHAG
jgi:pimeloyl-ACP methyl ester carboxylesterase